MPQIDTTLLDLDRAPSLDELKAFFKNTTGRRRNCPKENLVRRKKFKA